MIVPVGLEVCQSVRQFSELGDQVELPRLSRCPRPKEECGGLEPLRKNGKYSRQVIYWGMLFVMAILRLYLCAVRAVFIDYYSVVKNEIDLGTVKN